MPEQIKQLEDRVEQLEKLTRGLLNASEADPLMVKTLGLIMTSTGSKGADTEDVTIDEAGAATKVVMNDPDGFLLLGDKYIPYFTS